MIKLHESVIRSSKLFKSKHKKLSKQEKLQVENTQKDGLQTLLHWMEVNESGPYSAIPATLLSQMKSSVKEDLMFHFQHSEKFKQANQTFTQLLKENFKSMLMFGDDEMIIFEYDSPVCVVSTRVLSTYLEISITGLESMVKKVVNCIEATGRTKKQPIVSRIHKNTYGFDAIELTLPVVKDVENIAAFYPFVDQTPEAMWKEFSESSSNVLLFIGPPGVGKTNYIRRMIDARGYEDEVHLVDNEALLLDPDLMGYVQSDASMSLLITEDADRFVAKRQDENISMVGLLNASAGIAGGRIKFIISTNLPNLNEVDEALVRPGRCHKVVQFRKLKPEEALAARESAGLTNEGISFDGDVTLAETLNTDNGSKKLMTGMGFSLK